MKEIQWHNIGKLMNMQANALKMQAYTDKWYLFLDPLKPQSD